MGPYEIVGRLGGGSMGEVYRARDTRLGREVAIKVLPEGLSSDAERLSRFEREARLASSLNHPNIIAIYDIGQFGATRFIAMELVEGRTLREVLSAGRLSMQRLLEIAVQAAEGLARAHEAGIVHRDLKPENLMVTRDGLVKMLDFGLGKAKVQPPQCDSQISTLNLEEGRTLPGAVLGTAEYMSPEQASGREVDFRSDQFSFGVLLYEMVTGRRPFRGATPVQTLAAIIEEEPEPIAALNPKAPAPFRWIVERCLAKDPKDRYASTWDLARDLKRLRDHLFEVEGVSQLPKRAVWSRLKWLGAAGLFLLLLALVIVATPLRTRLFEWFASARIPQEKQLAVLPFTNVGGEPPNQAFCDGVVETLTSKLTQLEQFQGSLRVVPASEVREGKVTSVREAARKFGVNLAITGSVQRTGDQLRLTTNLVDTKTLRQLRARTIDARVGDITILQDGVVAQVAEMLELELQPEARSLLAAGTTAVPEAYDLYLQGRGYLQRYYREENIDSALRVFRQALEKDPDYALAHAGLSEACWRKYNLTKDQHWITQAQESCRRAIELNDHLAPVHVTCGLVHTGTGRYEEAVEEFQRALSLDPMSADAHRELARAYEALGKLREVESTYRKAIRLRPNYWAGYKDLGLFYYRRGRYPEAEAQFRRVIELAPDDARAHSTLGAIYATTGRYEEAERALRQSLAIETTAEAYSNLGTLYFFQRRYADAVPAMEKAIELGKSNYLIWGNLAEAYLQIPTLAGKAPQAYRRAIELAEQQLAVNFRDAQLRARLATYWAKLGEKKKALAEIDQARRLAPVSANVLFRSALVYELTGKRGSALDALEAAVQNGYSIEEVRNAVDLAGLRKHPRYQRLMSGRSSGKAGSRSSPN